VASTSLASLYPSASAEGSHGTSAPWRAKDLTRFGSMYIVAPVWRCWPLVGVASPTRGTPGPLSGVGRRVRW